LQSILKGAATNGATWVTGFYKYLKENPYQFLGNSF